LHNKYHLGFISFAVLLNVLLKHYFVSLSSMSERINITFLVKLEKNSTDIYKML